MRRFEDEEALLDFMWFPPAFIFSIFYFLYVLFGLTFESILRLLRKA